MRRIKFKLVKQNGMSCTEACIADYALLYEEGKTTKAIKGSMGIFCFKTRKEAETWMYNDQSANNLRILRVIPIGKGKTPECRYPILGLSLFDLYVMSRTPLYPVPEGTICYPEVRVIKEVK